MLKNAMSITEISQPFSSYEALKMGQESSLKLENVVFRLLELPITAENDVIVEQSFSVKSCLSLFLPYSCSKEAQTFHKYISSNYLSDSLKKN